MELEEARDILANCIDDYVIGEYCSSCDDKESCKNDDCIFSQAIEVVLNHVTKQEKMIESAKDRIEYYLMGNSTLNDFNAREKELEKLLNILKKAEENK